MIFFLAYNINLQGAKEEWTLCFPTILKYFL